MSLFSCFASKATEQHESLIAQRTREAQESGKKVTSQAAGDLETLRSAKRVGANTFKQQDDANQAPEGSYNGKYLWAAIGLAVTALALAAVAAAIVFVPLLAGVAMIGAAVAVGAGAAGAAGGSVYFGYKHHTEKA